MTTYTPSASKIIHNTRVDFSKKIVAPVVFLVQGDDKLPIVKVDLYNNGDPYALQSNSSVNIRVGKPDGTYVYNPALGWTSDRKSVYVEITQQMVAVPARLHPVLEVMVGTEVANTGYIELEVLRNPIQNGMIESTSQFITIMDAIEKYPRIGSDGYWYAWNFTTGQFEKTEFKASGKDGANAFFAAYGTTSFADIQSAFDADRLVVVEKVTNGISEIYTLYSKSSSEIRFSNSKGDANAVSYNIISITSAGVWSTETHSTTHETRTYTMIDGTTYTEDVVIWQS